ncbi:UNVERIFIED_CONTAM: hypothetical protein GTU68_030080 [Idotea baltica]|nr:hypothetical protein [Idotea baltica]
MYGPRPPTSSAVSSRA